MASISFSPISGSQVDPTDAIRVTVDHDGTLIHVVVIVRYTEGNGGAWETATVGLLLSGDSFMFPYRTTFVSHVGNQYVVDITHEGQDGFDRDFDVSVYTAESASGASNANASYTSSAPDKTVDIVDPGGAIAPADYVEVQTSGIAPDDLEVFFAIGASDLQQLPFSLRTEIARFGGIDFPPYTVQDMGGGTYRITREGGWLKSMIAVAQSVEAGDDVQPITVFPETEVDPGDPPEVGNVSPAPGTPITTTTPLVFEVTDDSGTFRRIILAVAFSAGELAGVTEIAHDGDAFVGHYSTGCTRDPIAGGFRFTLLRAGGWPASPTLRVFAVDTAGNEV